MLIFPAIDLFKGKAVRLFKGDYSQMTVYSDDPVGVALKFKASGAGQIHIVDLEGAKSGDTPNLDTICSIRQSCGLFCEVGGGIRSMEVIDRYLGAGIDRVILGTAAVKNRALAVDAVKKYGERIAIGVDIRDGQVAINGWTETAGIDALDFCEEMQSIGVKTVICTDISKDGAMRGTNTGLYRRMSERFGLDIIASGGVSSLDDIKALAGLGLYGAIIGKAYYTGAIDLESAIGAAK